MSSKTQNHRSLLFYVMQTIFLLHVSIQVSSFNKTPTMHLDIFRFQLANNRHLIGPLFTETTKATQAKSGQGKLSAKGPLSFFIFSA